MPVRRIVAHPAVEADTGRVALQRGPIVFTAEGADNPNGRVRNLVLADAAPLSSEYRADLLGGVQVVKARVAALSYDAKGTVQRREQELVAIPYYSWANRGPGEMNVWIARSDDATRVQPYPSIASRAKTSSSDTGREVSGTRALTRTVNDQDEPRTSNDTRTGFFHWWPKKGTTEWLQYDFAEPATVSSAQVYWYDDTGTGQVRPPASWRVLYKDGESWKPVETQGAYGTDIDRFNKTAFRPVKTDGLRLEVVLQPQFSAGVQEWKVE
jgi:hypothetical protein